MQTLCFKIESEHFSVTNTQTFVCIQNKLQFQDIILQQFMATGIWKNKITWIIPQNF